MPSESGAQARLASGEANTISRPHTRPDPKWENRLCGNALPLCSINYVQKACATSLSLIVRLPSPFLIDQLPVAAAVIPEGKSRLIIGKNLN